jgi:hypothetical protein
MMNPETKALSALVSALIVYADAAKLREQPCSDVACDWAKVVNGVMDLATDGNHDNFRHTVNSMIFTLRNAADRERVDLNITE